jgi:hypothetical protein
MFAVAFIDWLETAQKRVAARKERTWTCWTTSPRVPGAASGKGIALAERPIGNEVHVATSGTSCADRSGPASGRYDAIVIVRVGPLADASQGDSTRSPTCCSRCVLTRLSPERRRPSPVSRKGPLNWTFVGGGGRI